MNLAKAVSLYPGKRLQSATRLALKKKSNTASEEAVLLLSILVCGGTEVVGENSHEQGALTR